MILEEFSVSLQPAEIRKCVSHMRDRVRECLSLNGFFLKLKCPDLVEEYIYCKIVRSF